MYDLTDYFLEDFESDHVQIIRVNLFAPHEGQIAMYDQFITAKEKYGCKFFTLPIGRRFGKTTMIYGVRGEEETEGQEVRSFINLAVEHGERVGIFYPKGKDGKPSWNGIMDDYFEWIASKNSSDRVYNFHSGGVTEFWSLSSEAQKEEGRGRNYALVAYDETQKIKGEILDHHIEQVVKPLLLDYPDSIVVFLGTADGIGSMFHELSRRGIRTAQRMAANGDMEHERAHPNDIEPIPLKDGIDKFSNWVTIRYSTYDNPRIRKQDIEEMRIGMDALTFQQEVHCRFVDIGRMIWCYMLEYEEVQKKTFTRGLKTRFDEPLYLSMDFNKQPMTCTLMQKRELTADKVNNTLKWYTGHEYIKEFVTNKEDKQGIYDLVFLIQNWIRNETGIKVGKWFKRDGHQKMILGENNHPIVESTHDNPFIFRITGDATGNHGSSIQSVQTSYYHIVCDLLDLHNPRRVLNKLPKSNPLHKESSKQINLALEAHPHFLIDEIGCPVLKKDMLGVPGTPERNIDKKKLLSDQGHVLDNARYMVNSFGFGWD
ncbi:MAG: hypothetical protein ACPGXZ_06040 [Saprospiraceae bacterium]